jgi:hypothetical protein
LHLNGKLKVYFFGEIREMNLPMFKLGAMYKAEDVINLVITKTDDNRIVEKRLLRADISQVSLIV